MGARGSPFDMKSGDGFSFPKHKELFNDHYYEEEGTGKEGE